MTIRSIPPRHRPWYALWLVLRMQRYFCWGLFHRMAGPLCFRYIGGGVKFNGRVRIEKPCSDISLGDRAMIGIGCYFLATTEGKIEIGVDSLINDYCFIASNYGVTIEGNVMIAEHVSIRDYDHGFSDSRLPINKQGLRGGPIVIGEGSWIGRGVMITGNVKIGRGCVVGANAVVTRDLPDFSVAVGVPARVIRLRSETNQSPIA